MKEGDMMGAANSFAQAIQTIAKKGLTDRHGRPLYTGRISGYVCNVYPEGDEWEGTIDVQEFGKYDDFSESGAVAVGLHEHVRISAIQNNKTGYLLVPQMYSEVVIVQDPSTQEEYVIAFSHVDVIQIQSHQKVSIGVSETKEFEEDKDDDKDFDNLEQTGSSAHTFYDKDTICELVTEHDKEGDEPDKVQDGTVSRTVTKDGITERVGEKTSIITENTKRTLQIGENLTITLDGSGKVEINANGTELTIDNKGQSVKIGGSDSAQISVNSGGNVTIGQAQDNAVLFTELNTILTKLFNYLATTTTATQIGPQPLLFGPQIGALAAELPKMMSKKVMIAK
jgi:hypothetical protein